MAAETKIMKFYSDSAFSHFKDAAEWRHASNFMEINDAKLEIEFRGDVDPVLIQMGEQAGGRWNYKRKEQE